MNVPRWNHTAHYYDILLKSVPSPCSRALEIGCGEGDFARSLAKSVGRLDALDKSREVIEVARANSADLPNLRFLTADFLTHPLEPASYDFIAALASLHHLPFEPSIERMKYLIRPGGVLGVIGLWRSHGPIDFIMSAMAFPVSRWHQLCRGAASMNAPIAEPEMTLDELHAGVARLLPGAVIQRQLLWRYSLVWRKPEAASEPRS